MPKISTSIALALYEEDCEIRKELLNSRKPSLATSDPLWSTWYQKITDVENKDLLEKEVIANEYDCSDDCSDDDELISTRSLFFTRRIRRVSKRKAKKRLERISQISSLNYSKRVEDSMHFTSKVKDETKILKHNHPLMRAKRLIKRAKKFN